MASCEKCWTEAGIEAFSSTGDKVEIYHRLLTERNCTPEQEAGYEATECPNCRRLTVHMYAKQCTACGSATGRGGAMMDPDFRYEQLCRDEDRKRIELVGWCVALVVLLPVYALACWVWG